MACTAAAASSSGRAQEPDEEAPANCGEEQCYAQGKVATGTGSS
jgi:hypothetical protein